MKISKRFLIIGITSIVALIVILFISFFICAYRTGQDITKNEKGSHLKRPDSIIYKKLIKHDTLLVVDNHKVIIKVCPHRRKGTFLVLHGWNLSADDWCTKTSLCSKVLEKGYDIVMPDMGKSVYQEHNYPETYPEWRVYPTRKWLSDTLVPMLQKDYSLLLETENDYIVGLSTGARGVALMLLDFPSLFKGAAAFSGDYDQTKIQDDYLVTGYYGPYETFKDRWLRQDNPLTRIKEYKTPIYLGHGKLDQIVPPEQTIMFYDSLKKYHPGLKIKLNMPDAQHDYYYWDSEVDNFLKFFGI
ncbi:MAG: prolyl oligopeptidase family serine peptidase [Bacteroidales bacterium]|jgi:S-formylglutathione hydrolase FrmB